MKQDRLNKEYFDWMCYLISNDDFEKNLSYYKLLSRLHEINFQYSLPMDGNREEDGINLRYIFGYERGYEDQVIASYLDNKTCSVLEIMVALAVRCEEDIMHNPELGDRTSQWFWVMITSLNLDKMSDDRFDLPYVDDVISVFLNRQYRSNGEGGLFIVNHPVRDMRDIDIWYQMCAYLNEIEDY